MQAPTTPRASGAREPAAPTAHPTGAAATLDATAPDTSRPDRDAPPWRTCVTRALTCWFGGVLLLILAAGTFSPDNPATMLPSLVLMVAIAVVSTLGALVIEALSGRQLAVGPHAVLIAVACGVLAGLFSFNVVVALGAAAIGLVAAGLGAFVTLGEPTWRRYVIALAVAFAIYALQAGFAALGGS